MFALLYAGDTANCADTVISLQRQLQRIELFCTKTGMRKTKIVVFRNGGFYGPMKNGFTKVRESKQLLPTSIWV